MTIVELRNRLTDIIEENERRGWAERNDSDMTVNIQMSKRIYEHRKIKYASSAWIGLSGPSVFELITENEPIWRNGNRKGVNK